MGGIPIIFHKQRSGYKCETGNGIIPFKGNVIFLKHANLSYTKRKRFKQKMSVLYVYVIYTFNIPLNIMQQ